MDYDNKIKTIIPNLKHVDTIDIDLLLSLFDFQTPTMDNETQELFQGWIVTNFILKNNIYCKIEKDSYGNMYITKGKHDLYPCVVSHIDTVHRYKKDFKSYVCGDYVIAMSEGQQCGLGADPKAGLYILLQLLLRTENIKCVLFLNEESGKF